MRDKFCNETKKLVASDTTLATSGTAEGIRTPDLLVRSQTLYPTELQPHTAASQRQLSYITTSPKELQVLFSVFFIFLHGAAKKTLFRPSY